MAFDYPNKRVLSHSISPSMYFPKAYQFRFQLQDMPFHDMHCNCSQGRKYHFDDVFEHLKRLVQPYKTVRNLIKAEGKHQYIVEMQHN